MLSVLIINAFCVALNSRAIQIQDFAPIIFSVQTILIQGLLESGCRTSTSIQMKTFAPRAAPWSLAQTPDKTLVHLSSSGTSSQSEPRQTRHHNKKPFYFLTRDKELSRIILFHHVKHFKAFSLLLTFGYKSCNKQLIGVIDLTQ